MESLALIFCRMAAGTQYWVRCDISPRWLIKHEIPVFAERAILRRVSMALMDENNKC